MNFFLFEQGSHWRQRILDSAWLLAIGVGTSIWCLAAAPHVGVTFDEPLYLRAGLEHWRTGSNATLMKYGVMPLAADWQTFSLFLAEKLNGRRLNLVSDLAGSLPRARAMTLFFWWALLIYALRIGRSLAGPWGGRLAVAFVAFEPVLLGHAVLATSDVAVTACLTALFFEFNASRQARWPRRLGLIALLFGIALLAKTSALAFGGIGMLVIGTLHRTPLPKLLREVALVVAGGLAVVLLYCGSDWQTEPDFIAWAHTLPEGGLRNTFIWIAENLRIFTNGGEGIVQQIKHNFRGHPTYLLGNVYPRAVWYYFPLALTIKSSLLLLFLPVALGILRPRSLWNWPCLVAAALLLFSLVCRVQIGIRLMFPLMAIAAIGLAAAGVNALTALGSNWQRASLTALLALGVVWNAVVSIVLWPHTMIFTNPLWGGTLNGHRWLSDSNHDWGQGLPELREWQRKNGVQRLALWYFGQDPAARSPAFHQLRFEDPSWTTGNSPADLVRGQCVAVSLTMLAGPYLQKSAAGREAQRFFQTQKPVARTPTFFIYDFRDR